jgi:hypothetical protein
MKGITAFRSRGYSEKVALYQLCEATALGKRFAKVKMKNANPASDHVISPQPAHSIISPR